MGKSGAEKSSMRSRITVDLEAYPDVRDMLMEAHDATGEDKTAYVVAALRKHLPDLIAEAIESRQGKLDKLRQKYGSLSKQKPKVA